MAKRLIQVYRITGLFYAMCALALILLEVFKIVAKETALPGMMVILGLCFSMSASVQKRLGNNGTSLFCTLASLVLIVCGMVIFIVNMTSGNFKILL